MMLCTGTAIVWAGFNGFGGIWLDYTGKIQYFDEKLEDVESVKERLGYTGPNSFFLPQRGFCASSVKRRRFSPTLYSASGEAARGGPGAKRMAEPNRLFRL